MGATAIRGEAKTWNTKSIEIMVMAIPASEESRAARGMWRRSQPAKQIPTNSTAPLRKQANNPILYARSASPLLLL